MRLHGGFIMGLALALLVPITGCLTGRDDAVLPPIDPTQRAFLWASPFSTLVVETDFVEGRVPSEMALAALGTAIKNVTAKTNVRMLSPTPIPADVADPKAFPDWTVQDLLALHARTFDTGDPDALGAGDLAFLHVLYVNGNTSAAPGAEVGLSLGRVIVVFYDEARLPPLHRVPSTPPQDEAVARVERAVLIHEFGHSVGLVNNGLPMVHPHEYAPNSRHSSNPASVMYPGLGYSNALIEALSGKQEIPYQFDGDDLADLAAARALESSRP